MGGAASTSTAQGKRADHHQTARAAASRRGVPRAHKSGAAISVDGKSSVSWKYSRTPLPAAQGSSRQDVDRPAGRGCSPVGRVPPQNVGLPEKTSIQDIALRHMAAMTSRFESNPEEGANDAFGMNLYNRVYGSSW